MCKCEWTINIIIVIHINKDELLYQSVSLIDTILMQSRSFTANCNIFLHLILQIDLGDKSIYFTKIKSKLEAETKITYQIELSDL